MYKQVAKYSNCINSASNCARNSFEGHCLALSAFHGWHCYQMLSTTLSSSICFISSDFLLLKELYNSSKSINAFKYHVFAPMGRFQLELTVNCPSQETEVTSTPTRPVDNVVITTKGLQDRNIHIFDGTRVENKGKLILTEIFPSVKKPDI